MDIKKYLVKRKPHEQQPQQASSGDQPSRAEPKTTRKRDRSSEEKKEKVAPKKPSRNTKKKKEEQDDDDDYFEPIEEFDDDEDEDFVEEEDDQDIKPGSKNDPPKAKTSRSSRTRTTEAGKPPADTSKAKTKEEPKEEEEEPPKKSSKGSSFYKLLHREGPRALGTRELPVGKENCLAGYTFVLSGELETMSKEVAADLIKRYGGRVTGSVSGRTTFLVRGRDAGATKTAKAQQLGTKILDEDGFYKLIQTEDSKKEVDSQGGGRKTTAKGKAKADHAKEEQELESIPATSTTNAPDSNEELWTEKYKPKTINEIVGNKELIRKIAFWVEHWQESLAKNFPPSKENDGITGYRALLLSGPPGIGKTTTAHVVARTYGYEPLELNASDTRSKKVLQESITEMMDNRTMTEFFCADDNKEKEEKEEKERLLKKGKVLLIMDEVDGMSGGDRGGSAELASLIRKTKIPIICICNDVRSQKVQPLLRVCYDARFKRTPANQLRSRIMTIAYREKLKIQPNAVDELVQSTHNDLRKIINILSTYRLQQDSMNYDQAKEAGQLNEKYLQLSVFDIPPKLLSSSSWRSMSLAEKSDIYFHDYSLSHLMMFESYLKSDPAKARCVSETGDPKEAEDYKMQLIAEAAEAMADGDLVDAKIHGTVQQYSLMPVHSIFSCVRPAYYMEGSLAGQKLFFPGWLGQNSKAMKFSRLLNDVRSRIRTKTSANRYEIRQNYVPTFNDRIFGYLKSDEYDEAIDVMDEYNLDKENLETLSDLQITSKKPMAQLSTKQKTTLTKTYNSRSHPTIFAEGGPVIKKHITAPAEDREGELFEEEEEEPTTFGEDVSEEEEEDDVKADALIKAAQQKRRQRDPGEESSHQQSRRHKRRKA